MAEFSKGGFVGIGKDSAPVIVQRGSVYMSADAIAKYGKEALEREGMKIVGIINTVVWHKRVEFE